MRTPARLIAAQKKVWDSGLYQPTEVSGSEVSYCNAAVQAVLIELGCHLLDGLVADQMVLAMRETPEWLAKPMEQVQELANQGVIIVAGLLASELGQSHGHVATATPGSGTYSGHWNCKVPLIMNLGRKGTCSRSGGVNYAFVPRPDFYALKESL